jgi:hypothetical protein
MLPGKTSAGVGTNGSNNNAQTPSLCESTRKLPNRAIYIYAKYISKHHKHKTHSFKWKTFSV